ncbi:hypothetical protein ACSVDE_00870 [Pseudalkalibacillus sp. Hm43]|uniref:hypothetical protein n=1 Tax=Pseudalkalibacillus sp. Hm43 TaxID=3450742 RepID=UPI003F443956
MSKSKKEFLWLLYYLLLLIGSIEIYTYLNHLMDEAANNFNTRPVLFYMMMTAFVIGIYLGIPHIWKQFKKEGSWSLNVHKILFVCLPLVILIAGSYGFFLSYTLYDIVRPLTDIFIKEHFEFGLIVTAIFGFNLAKCLYKKTERLGD